MTSRTKKNLIISVVLLVLASVAFAYVLLEIGGKGQRLQEQLTVMANNQAQESAYLNLRRIADSSSIDRQQLASYFFAKQGDSIDFLNLVESYAPQMNVALTTDTLKQIGDAKNGGNMVQADFSFSGTYEDVTKFIRLMENLPYVSEITAVSLEARSTSQWTADITTVVNIYAYDDNE